MKNKQELINRVIDFYLTGHNLKAEESKAVFSLKDEYKAINYTRSCDKLNDKILQPFRVFVNANYWEQDNEYICKKTNKKEDLDDIIRCWHQEY